MRKFLLKLAEDGLCFPIGTDLVLHEHQNIGEILCDGDLLGAVLAENADRWNSPIALPVMDLMLEKQAMLLAMGVAESDIPQYQFFEKIDEEMKKAFENNIQGVFSKHSRLSANVEAIGWVARKRSDLIPCAMVIGPFSLATKLLSDPISPVYMAGMGDTLEDNDEVALFEDALDFALRTVIASVKAQIAQGAKLVFVAEPAGNTVYFSPKQLAAGSDVFERYVMEPNRKLRDVVIFLGCNQFFHCCGELTTNMVRDYGSLNPVVLSLGSSRALWVDAAVISKDIVIYGNLPSKKFIAKELTAEMVGEMSGLLRTKMRETEHPFILGTECDVLHVPGNCDEIMSKVTAMMQADRYPGCICEN